LRSRKARTGWTQHTSSRTVAPSSTPASFGTASHTSK
jgi:hypothetical protein